MDLGLREYRDAEIFYKEVQKNILRGRLHHNTLERHYRTSVQIRDILRNVQKTNTLAIYDGHKSNGYIRWWNKCKQKDGNVHHTNSSVIVRALYTYEMYLYFTRSSF